MTIAAATPPAVAAPAAAAPFARTRRMRATEALRGLARETRLDPAAFVYPLFAVEGRGVRTAKSSLTRC